MARNVGLSEICSFLSANRQKKFLITFHSMGDRDGVGSALALSKYLKNSTVVTPDFITHNAKKMLEQIGFKQKIDPIFPKGMQGIIVLDTNTIDTLGPLKGSVELSKLPIIFIDHHLPQKIKNQMALLVFNDESYNSTASMVYEILKKLDFKVDSSSSMALLNGIISDSSDFHNASSLTFMQISQLLDSSKVGYSQIMSFFTPSASSDSRYEVVSDIRKADVEIVGKYLVIYGNSHSPPNVVADMALKLGADAALFWKDGEKEASISARLRPPLDTALSIHLGKMMREVGAMLNGSGGGHPCAAGAYGPNKEMAASALETAISELKEKLNPKG